MVKRILAWIALALGVFALAAHFVTPWPSVWAIRAVFDSGAATASAALEKHLPGNVTTRSGVRYDAADPDALFDIHRGATADPAAPTIVWIHGGGFVSGRRGDLTNYAKILAGRGFVVVNVDYTIAPTATYPTPTRQLGRALAYLEKNAATLGINGDAFVLAGDSAGAQIAAQLATVTTAPDYARRTGVAPTIAPGKLKGALLYCGVFDVTSLDSDKGGVLGWFVRTVTWAYSGSRDWRSVKGFEYLSVTPHVTAQFPPTFISAGNADPLAPQSVALAKQLADQGVAVDRLFFPAEYRPQLGHEYQFNLDTAAGRQALDRSVEWLRNLSRAEVPPTDGPPAAI